LVDVEALLLSTSAVLNGHFQLASLRHSPSYVEKFRIMENPAATVAMCGMVADHYRDAGVEVVVGPALGGVILAYEIARQLGVRSIYAEKDAAGRLMFDRGFQLKPGERTLVVDDVLTTGGSVRQVLDLVHGMQAMVIGVGFLIDRNSGAEFGVPFYACHNMAIESYPPDDCPLCRQGVPLTIT
jgi:orotate phosphoribosyltransferase